MIIAPYNNRRSRAGWPGLFCDGGPIRAGGGAIRIGEVFVCLIGWVAVMTAAMATEQSRGRTGGPLVTGDEVAIQAALAALPATGGCVELGAGVFTISRPLVIDRDDVELRGAGARTVLVLAAHANCPVLIIGSESTPVHRTVRRVSVRDLVIDGNRLEQDFECYGGVCNERGRAVLRNNGITVRGAEEVVIERVVTRWARSGGVVLEKNCRRVRITELEAHDNEFDGLAAYETEESVFMRMQLHHNLAAGISVDWRFDRNRIVDSELRDNGSQGIFMRDAEGNLFENLRIRANGAQGIFLAETPELPGTAARDNRFAGLMITENRAQGIRLNDASCTGNTLEGSSVKANLGEDVSVATPGLLTITPEWAGYMAAVAGD